MSDDLIKKSDTINRSDAINLCEKWRSRTNEHHDKNGWYIADTLLKDIKELPSADRPSATEIKNAYHEGVRKGIAEAYEAYGADRQQEWIPCRERLPNEYKTVLVTWEHKGTSYTTTAYRKTKNAVTYWESKDQSRYNPLNVLAWMPLPEPWKGVDDE